MGQKGEFLLKREPATAFRIQGAETARNRPADGDGRIKVGEKAPKIPMRPATVAAIAKP